ncbi:probable E3 ubiquitin-protein ligase LUL4 [Mercurialis annua]|uniref:probable E3 ubiquitin-protein ligase LUL4 n=1 Tax=Mercurialis annua TaxID=3986 RepID=UPI0021604BFE|nr:probable E3 ubiquitin-protein ligase LUL4 [Mercurialis annua]
MGISFSSNNRRRNNHQNHHPPFYHHQHPPPPPPPPPPYHYSTEPPLSLPAPPPPPPPPPQSAYNPYPTHAPPQIQPYYSSHNHPPNYYSCNYANRINYQPFYYPNQTNGWSGSVRPNGVPPGQQQLIEPAPYIEHQNAKKVRNDVNVHKDTLRLEIDEQNPDTFLVSFVFDALFDGSITIFYFAKEEANCKFVPVFPEAHMPVKIPFQKGLGQKFFQPSGTGIDLGFFELNDLSKPSPGDDVFPLVIVAETSLAVQSTDEQVDDSESNTTGNMQISQAILEKKNNEPFQVRVIKQILWIDGVRYEMRELYGIGTSAAEGFNDSDPGKECVICMTEPKDTAVLPCRHMCMCSDCAKELRLQSNKCPICRQPIEELIEIRINNGDE